MCYMVGQASPPRKTGLRSDATRCLALTIDETVARATLDNALQLQGHATECTIHRVPRVARILDIFKGVAEIQAQVIARRLIIE